MTNHMNAANADNGHTQPEFCTISEAADFVRVSQATIRRFLTIRKLTRYKCGARTLIKIAELRALIVPEEVRG